MKQTILSASALRKSQIVAIGKQLENNYRQIVFDCRGFGEGITGVMLVHQRSEDTAPYIVCSADSNRLEWTVTDVDTAFFGYGKGELRISFADGLAKSITFTTLTLKSITGDTTVPSALQSWYDQMIAYIDEHSVTLDEVGQVVEDYLEEHPVTAPVQSVNGLTGEVVITAASLGALTSETDPVFLASPAHGITAQDIETWNNKSDFSGAYADLTGKPTIPTKTSDLTNDSGYITSIPSEYVTETEMQTALASKADTADVPTKTSDLTNDSGYITSAPVSSVNGRTGSVTGLAEAWTVQSMTASDTAVTLNPNVFYVFPEMASLAVTVTAVGMYAFRFTSGTTATTLTVNGATMPDSFAVESGKVYEVNVYQGYGVATSWTA